MTGKRPGQGVDWRGTVIANTHGGLCASKYAELCTHSPYDPHNPLRCLCSYPHFIHLLGNQGRESP